MSKRVYAVTAILAGAIFMPGLAQASCYSVWYERNQIYADAGYCFKSSRAIRVFDNAGCRFDDISAVPLSARQRLDKRYCCS